MSQWIGFDPHAADYIGLLHEIFDARDERPAAEQANDRYAHGGGWQPMANWTVGPYSVITYPGDEPLWPAATYWLPLSNETVFVYAHGFVMVLHDDNTHEIARMD